MMITVQCTKISAEMIQFPFLQIFAKKKVCFMKETTKNTVN